MGCARNRASELFSTKNSGLQYMLRVLSYCAALDVPTTTVRTVSSWLTARYLVGGPGWSGAGPADVGTVVLSLSVDDPGAPMWCVKRRWVVSWLVGGCRGCCCGSWCAGAGCGGGPGRGRPGYGVLSSPGFCGGWFIWFRWLPVVIVPGGGGRGGCRAPRRLRARRGFASR